MVIDVEGAEFDMLDPHRYPALKGMDIIAELHPTASRDLVHVITERFSPSHSVELVEPFSPSSGAVNVPFELEMDRLVARYECRYGYTPWVVMKARDFPKN